MLKNLIEISSSLHSKIVDESTVGGFQLPKNLADKLEFILNANPSPRLINLKIDKNTSAYKTSERTDPQWVVFPNQFYYFAGYFFDFSCELIKYFKILENLQSICSDNGLIDTEIFYGSWDKIKANVESIPVLRSYFVEESDLELFCHFVDKKDKSYRLGGKSVLNDNSGKGPVSIREPGGCFGSIILTRINMPAVSAQAFAELAYALLKDPVVYSELHDYCVGFIHHQSISIDSSSSAHISLPKPFLLLAGISGTGKTRFVREQAAAHRGGDLTNYCLIPVRPDWHEPSDLLGYVSRIGANGSARYVVTDLLRFVVRAWLDAVALEDASDINLPCKSPDEITPYWLCLDEMNLAPVEQYFADYLSVVETRKWNEGNYTCDPLLKSAAIMQLEEEGRRALRKELKLDDTQYDELWGYFLEKGIPLPPNLIVAGTVNMDETTHGFSRKVIDRAFTIDFGEFFPNDFNEFLSDKKSVNPKKLSFPVLSSVTASDLTAFDADGKRSIDFLSAINSVLKDTPFELAYRALNELLLAVVCFKPENEAALQAVWDDFLMSKVLPRIDGDNEKLSKPGKPEQSGMDRNVITELLTVIETQFKEIIASGRPDLLCENANTIPCRAKKKLDWMKARLTLNSFTTFWP